MKDSRQLRGEFLNRMDDENGLMLFDYMLDVQFWIKDRDCRYIHANICLLRNYALQSLDEIIGKTDFDLSADYLASRYVEGDKQVLQSGEVLANQIELVGQFDGIVNWYSTTKVPVRDSQGNVIGTAGFNHELSSGQVSQAIYGEMGSIIHFIKDNLERQITVGELAEKACLSVSAFERSFKKRFKMPPLQYVKRLRLNLACELLMTTEKSISQIALECGFCDHSYLTKVFRSRVGMSPRSYRRQFWGAKRDD